MADDKTKTTGAEQNAQRPPESSASPDADRRKTADRDEIKVPVPRVAAQKGALVGDENQPDPRKVEAEIVSEEQTAQVMPVGGNEPVDVVPVHETYVQMDEVVLDPSSPEAVQIPDAGRGFLDLPIHDLVNGTPEERIAAGENDEEARSTTGTSADENAEGESRTNRR